MDLAAVMPEATRGPQPAQLRPLHGPQDLGPARALLVASLPWDRVAKVADEKLLAGNGQRTGYTLGAYVGGELVGLLAQAGRWLKLLVVHPAARRHGIGTQLLQAATSWLSAQSAGQGEGAPRPRLRVGDHPGNYLSPGIDEREVTGQAFLQARGFVEIGRNLNLRAPLGENPLLRVEQVAASLARVASHGYHVRRATAGDVAALDRMVTTAFHRVWAYEVRRALGAALGGEAAQNTPELPEGPSVHVALAPDGELVAFAAHDGNNRGLGWFGPTGTLPSHRGRGLGEALLLCCLRDVMDDVAPSTARPDAGVIAWVGPVEYYARTCGAVPDRRFVVYEECP